MKISTAEIKMLIRKCVESEGFYTADDFKKYINLHSKKEFTRGQISGALAQLVDSKDISRIDRGLYSKNNKLDSDSQYISYNAQNAITKKEIYNAVCNAETNFERAFKNINIWELNNDFELISRIHDLRTSISEIKKICKPQS